MWPPYVDREPYSAGASRLSSSKKLSTTSDESGVQEIYVRPFPDMDAGRWQISTGGGVGSAWTADGRELFYEAGAGDRLMVVPVTLEPAFDPGPPDVLFERPFFRPAGGPFPQWDASPDGQRFVFVQPPDVQAESTAGGSADRSRPRIDVVINWFEELKARVPVD
jgi:hypothetical protein